MPLLPSISDLRRAAVVPLTEPAKRDNATSPSVLCIKLTPENTETLFKLCEEGNCLLQDYLSNLCNREIAMIRFTRVATEGLQPYVDSFNDEVEAQVYNETMDPY